MMKCEESQRAFSPYLDGELTLDERLAMDEHLDVCPVCRQQLDESRLILRHLSLVARPAPPARLAASISEALSIEREARRAQPSIPVRERFARWLEPHLMPYAVGAFYSLLLFVAVFGALRQQLQTLRNLAESQRLEAGLPYQLTWVGDEFGPYDVRRPLAPGIYAAARSPFGEQSPSLDPHGALAELAWAPPSSGRPDDDDMVVVADVYGNGNASLAAVVEPPRNPRMLDELQDALRKNPAFVPASLDRRPQTMRVVFVLQKMNVQEQSY
ncbi:MAG TPA: anti-sigma factor [Pyrinomonadaceae bacterium]|jgi:anti-sigma factor RsiW|nr:anti-sigma factor [Pyrinomonadaceae bacterium]